jgi:hypothetical protein
MFLSSPQPAFGNRFKIITHILYNCLVCLDWFSANVNIQDHYVQRITAYVRAPGIYLELGNTSSAVHKTWTGKTLSDVEASALSHLVTNDKVQEITQLRHPEPGLVVKLELKIYPLHIWGSRYDTSHGLVSSGTVISLSASVNRSGQVLYLLNRLFLSCRWQEKS